jgi:Ca2+-binding EF-hand superfamily protein|tara:strand:+ start:317 stop:607 length:291 start_codon:yes stop_codon:yes gene_type:complete
MKKLVNKFIGILGFLLLSATAISAQGKEQGKRQKPPSIQQIFKDLDSNEDGKISLKEVKGRLKKDFKKIDINEDGFITKKELKNAPKPERTKRPRN